jgi:hypothetical protein
MVKKEVFGLKRDETGMQIKLHNKVCHDYLLLPEHYHDDIGGEWQR